MRTRTIAIATAACAAAVLAGCSSGGTKHDTPPPAPANTTASTTASTSTSDAPADTTADSTTPSAAAGTFTKAGSTLAIGKQAIVPHTYKDQHGALGITVTQIVKGDPADLAALDLGDKVKGMVPYYIQETITNESGSNFAYLGAPDLDGVLGDGSEAQKVLVFGGGKFDKCAPGDATGTFTTKGASFASCTLVVAPAAASVVGAKYGDGSYSDGIPGTDYDNQPITWK